MKNLLLAALAVVPATLFAQEDFTITGKAGNLNAPAKAYLNYRVGRTTVIDSAEVVNGQFSFKGSVQNPTAASVLLMHNGENPARNRRPDAVQVFLEKGAITIQATDSISKGQVSGGPITTAFLDHKSKSAHLTAEMNKLNAKYAASSDEQKNDPEFMGSLQEAAGKIQVEQGQIDADFVKANPSSYYSLTLVAPKVQNGYEGAEELFNLLSAELRNTEIGQNLSKRIEATAKVAVGKIAPEFAQPDTAGNMVALSSFRGKYVLVDFWASWCGPCRQENPHVVAAYNKFKDKNFTILGVSLDQPGKKDAWMKAIHDDGLAAWTHVSELKFWDSEVVPMYAISGIPANFLLDPEGRIIAKNLRGKALEEKLAEVLK